MKKFFLIAIIAGLACVIASANVFAQESKNIAITAIVSGTQGVTLSAEAWDIQNITTGESRDSDTITATNSGTVPEKLELAAASAGDFGLADTAAEDIIAIWGKCAATDPGLTDANALTGVAGQTSDTVNSGAGLKVYLKYYAPTSITGTKSDGGATVTVSTIAP